MASSAAKINSNSNGYSEEIIYDTLDFTAYFEKVTSACLAKKDAAVVLGGVIKDPITNFRLYYIKQYDIDTTDATETELAEAKAESDSDEENVSSSSEKKTQANKLLYAADKEAASKKYRIPTAKDVIKDPQQVLATFLDFILRSEFDPKLQLTVKEEV